MLAAFALCLDLEWAASGTPARRWSGDMADGLRARAIAIVQSSWAIGYAAAALVSGLVLRHFDWHVVFFFGIIPALVTLWIQRRVPESELWKAGRVEKAAAVPFSRLFAGGICGRRWCCCWLTSSACSRGGDCSRGFRRSCRCR